MTSQWQLIMTSQWVMTLPGTSVATNLFSYVFSILCLIIILLWVVCNKNKNKFMFDQSGLENRFVFFV